MGIGGSDKNKKMAGGVDVDGDLFMGVDPGCVE